MGTNNALMMPLHPSKALASIVGTEPLSRAEVVRKVWAYIKDRKLQNPDNRREILADDKLAMLVGGSRVSMFELSKYLSRNLAAHQVEVAAAPQPAPEPASTVGIEAKNVFARRLFGLGRVIQDFVAPART